MVTLEAMTANVNDLWEVRQRHRNNISQALIKRAVAYSSIYQVVPVVLGNETVTAPLVPRPLWERLLIIARIHLAHLIFDGPASAMESPPQVRFQAESGNEKM
jgi:hypothetical protein